MAYLLKGSQEGICSVIAFSRASAFLLLMYAGIKRRRAACLDVIYTTGIIVKDILIDLSASGLACWLS